MKKEKYLLGQVKDNDLISEKHKKECKALNYFEHFLAFVSANSGSVQISAFASLLGVSVDIFSSAERIKICALTVVNFFLLI